MDDSFFMQILNSRCELFHFSSHIDFGESLCFTFLELKEKGALLHELEDEVYVFLVIEEAIETQNVLMFTVILYFDLLCELFDEVVVFDHFFSNFLKGKNSLSLLVNCLIGHTEFSLS
jgi:hypothetical protein